MTPNADIVLSAQNIHKRYGTLEVLKGVSLSLDAGEAVALVGSSGAGKSTLLQILGTLDRPDEGTIHFGDQAVHSFSKSGLTKFRNQRLGFVFQFHHLMPEFTALENVAMPAYISGMGKKQANAKAEELLNYLGLGDRVVHKPTEMSGGEQQRTAVARALMNDPQLLMADEPTGNLDTPNGERLMQLLLQLVTDKGLSILVATHNEQFAGYCHRQLSIADGRIV